MREDPRDPKDHCEAVEARHVEDSIGYPCERTAKQECDDCGAAICDLFEIEFRVRLLEHGSHHPLGILRWVMGVQSEHTEKTLTPFLIYLDLRWSGRDRAIDERHSSNRAGTELQ